MKEKSITITLQPVIKDELSRRAKALGISFADFMRWHARLIFDEPERDRLIPTPYVYEKGDQPANNDHS